MTITDLLARTIPLAVPDELATAEATDVTLIGEAMETVDVGPFDGAYIRLCATDLVVAVDQARRLLDQIEEAVLDARQERTEAEQHECYCGVRLDPEEACCGARSCVAMLNAERWADTWGGGI